MSGFFDLFKQQQAAPTTPAAPAAAAPNTPPGNLGDSPATTDATGKKMPGTGVAEQNPLDIYSKLMEDAAKNSDAQAPTFKLDPKVLGEVSSKMDFMSGVPQELMEKASKGDVQALLQVMQTTNQNAYKAALEHSSALTDTFINQRSDFETKQINKGVKTQLTHQSLSEAPNYNHPAVKNELNRVAEQFARANPDQSPQEIAKAAQKYIQDLAEALNPKAEVKDTKHTTNGEMDWSKYLG
jgi:hypothetical protein